MSKFVFKSSAQTGLLFGCCSLMAMAGAFAQTNISSAAADSEQAAATLEEVTVTGIRSSLEKAAELKRFAPSIQDSIVAEDIGKFPDQNIAESLQRVTGIAISRENGEGSKLTVRGFGPKFNLVQLNGRTLATTDKGREFDFQVLPAELVSGVDVVKASRANVPEGSLGAYVNTKTLRPLDNPGFQAAGSVQGRYQSLAESTDPRYSFALSNTFADDTIGVSLAAAAIDTTQRIDTYETAIWGRVTVGGEPGPFNYADGTELEDDVQVWYPGRARFSQAEEERERTSVNFTVQFEPNESFTSSFDAFYSDLEFTEITQGLQIPMQVTGWTDVLVSDNLTALQARKDDTLIDGLFRRKGGKSETLSLGLNGRYEGDGWSVEADLAYSEASSDPFNQDFVPQFVNQSAGADEFWALPGDYVDYDATAGDVPNVTTSYDLADPSILRSHFNWLESFEREDEITEFKLDFSKDLDVGVLESIDLGVRYTDREKDEVYSRFNHWCGNTAFEIGSDEWNDRFVCNAAFDHTDSLFTILNDDYLDDVSGDFPRSFVQIPNIQAYLDELGRFRQEPNWTDQIVQPNATINNTEETTAAYVQANFSGEISNDVAWSGNFGLRYVKTKTTSQGFRQNLVSIVPNWDIGAYNGENGWPLTPTFTDIEASFESKSYDNILPSLNVSFDFGNGLYVKAAASQVITRPALEDIGVNRTYFYNRAETFGSAGGNPDLDPYKANQFDLSLEYYAENGNAYSINYYRKDIGDFITTDREIRDTGISLPDYSEANGTIQELFTGKVNLDGGTVQGIELAGLHYFDYLPGFLEGLGLQANYTYIETDGSLVQGDDVAGVSAPSESLEGFSKDSYNIGLFYDKGAFQARIAYNWRSEYLKQLSGSSSRGQLSEHVEEYGQVDFSTSYDINDNFTFTGEIINLTDEELIEYADIRERVTLVEYNGIRYQIGLRAKF